MASPTVAANAYSSLAKILEQSGTAAKGAETGAGPSFSSLLKDAVSNVVDAGKKSDAQGNVKYPNVNPLVEMTDMREAQRSYEANLNIISATRRMIQRTLDILKA